MPDNHLRTTSAHCLDGCCVMWTALLVALLGVVLVWARFRNRRFWRLVEVFPGPPTFPLLGNVLQFGSNTAEFMAWVQKISREHEYQAYRLQVGPSMVFIMLTSPEDMEIVCSSNKLITKSKTYNYLVPWLGYGLLTSTGEKWRRHRKILTPTFHFKILEEFIDVFNANAHILLRKLEDQAGAGAFDIYNFVTLYALDNICETAMGLKVHAQEKSESEYVQAIRAESDIVMTRALWPWLGVDAIFNLTKHKAVHDNALRVLHATTEGVIKTRRAEIERTRASSSASAQSATASEDGVKTRRAFLNMLIESALDGSGMTDQDIREEVDTFMFEGHDTTSSGISFALWVLSWHQDIQERVYQEVCSVFPGTDDALTFRGLQELKYLETVIKETLRIYPSVPFFSRQLTEDTVLSDGKIAPRGATISVIVHAAHRNQRVWPEPLKFDPDRFSNENARTRHPYAYLPFSAGPRNCIGQKFAMLELKSAIAHVVRHFRLLPGTPEPDVVPAMEVILVSTTGIKVKLEPREKKG